MLPYYNMYNLCMVQRLACSASPQNYSSVYSRGAFIAENTILHTLLIDPNCFLNLLFQDTPVFVCKSCRRKENKLTLYTL